jgi:hypothetical protein
MKQSVASTRKRPIKDQRSVTPNPDSTRNAKHHTKFLTGIKLDNRNPFGAAQRFTPKNNCHLAKIRSPCPIR